MKNNIKPANQEEVAEQNKTVKVDKDLELRNELNVLKKELKQNKLIANGGFNEKNQEVVSTDKLVEQFTDLIEMKEIEMNKDMPEPATQQEIDLCLEEARKEYPEANEDEFWEIAAQIYKENY